MSLNFNSFNTLSLAVISSLVLMLTACGGSSSSSGSPSTSKNPVNIKAQEVGCNEATQQAMLNAVNKARSEGRYCYTNNRKTFYSASGDVKWNSKLANAASSYATDMAENNYYNSNHLDQNGGDLTGRVTATNYGQGKVIKFSENIASGQADLEEVMDDWLNSKKGHCESLMWSNAKDFGMACSHNANSDDGNYWVQTFGMIE